MAWKANDLKRLIALAERSRSGDHGAFAELCDMLKNFVWSKIRKKVRNKEDAEDLCQEVLLKLWTYLQHGWDAARCRIGPQLLCLVDTITQNAIRDFLRTEGRLRSKLDELVKTTPPGDKAADGFGPDDVVAVRVEHHPAFRTNIANFLIHENGDSSFVPIVWWSYFGHRPPDTTGLEWLRDNHAETFDTFLYGDRNQLAMTGREVAGMVGVKEPWVSAVKTKLRKKVQGILDGFREAGG